MQSLLSSSKNISKFPTLVFITNPQQNPITATRKEVNSTPGKTSTVPNPVFNFGHICRLNYWICSKLLKVDFVLTIMEITARTEKGQYAN